MQMPSPTGRDRDETPVYAISVAAALSGLHAQTLRQYDRMGLVTPARTSGRNRLYSDRDIERLQEVARLSEAGLNLAGIRRILALEEEVRMLRRRIDQLTQDRHSRALVVYRGKRRR